MKDYIEFQSFDMSETQIHDKGTKGKESAALSKIKTHFADFPQFFFLEFQKQLKKTKSPYSSCIRRISPFWQALRAIFKSKTHLFFYKS